MKVEVGEEEDKCLLGHRPCFSDLLCNHINLLPFQIASYNEKVFYNPHDHHKTKVYHGKAKHNKQRSNTHTVRVSY